MKRDKFSFLDMVAKSSSEYAKIAEGLKREYEAGKFKDPPRTYLGCRNWEDAWLYAFHRGCLGHDDYLKKEGEKIILVSFAGVDFNDAIVVALEKISKRIGINFDLQELRLFRTKISPRGIQKLRLIFPRANIAIFSEADERENPRLKWVNRNDV